MGCETTKPLDPGYKPSRRGARRNQNPTRPARPFSPQPRSNFVHELATRELIYSTT